MSAEKRTATTGVILAGGRSSRFGADKCFAFWKGTPFLLRVASAMRPHVDRLIVASRHDIDPSAYAAMVPDASILRDPAPFPGPVDGLRRALADDTSERVVVAGCDSPALTPEIVGRLIASTAPDRLGVLVHEGSPIYSVFAGPMCFVRARCRQDRLCDVTRGAAHVAVSGDGFNVNTTEERVAALQRQLLAE